VPRVFEKFAGRVNEALAKSPVKKRLFELVVAAGGPRRAPRSGPRGSDRSHAAARARRRTGAGEAGRQDEFAVLGGAPLDPAIAWLFLGLGAGSPGIRNDEASPVISVNRLEGNVPESVGVPLDNVEVRIAADGELLARGRAS